MILTTVTKPIMVWCVCVFLSKGAGVQGSHFEGPPTDSTHVSRTMGEEKAAASEPAPLRPPQTQRHVPPLQLPPESPSK